MTENTIAANETPSVMVPTTVHLEDGFLHTKGVDILQPLDAIDCAACAKHIISSKTEGDSDVVQKQLESTSRMFKADAQRHLEADRQNLAVVHVVSEVGKGYCIFDRVVWDLNNPLAMVDVYCGTVVDTLGLGSMAAYTMAKEMKKEVERLRHDGSVNVKNEDGSVGKNKLLIDVDGGPVRDVVSSLALKLPSVFKTSVANKLKECLKDCPIGQEDEHIKLDDDDEMT